MHRRTEGIRARAKIAPLAITTLVVALAAPAGASAASGASVSVSAGVLSYAASGSEADDLSIAISGGAYVLTDAGVAQLTPGSGCSQGASANQVSCSVGAVGQMNADLGGGDDSITSPALQAPLSIHGGAGDDTIATGPSAEKVWGDAGTDTVTYGARSARLYVSLDDVPNDGEPGEGDNVHADVERVVGGAGPDTLMGSAAADSLSGGPGADTLDGLAGADYLDGGAGADTVAARDLTPDAVVCGADDDAVIADGVDTVAADCEHVDGAGTGTTQPDAAPAERPAETRTATADPSAASSLASRLFGVDPGADLLASPAGVVRFPVLCPPVVDGGCSGTVTLAVVAKRSAGRHVTRLGRRHFNVHRGHSKVVQVHLSRRGRRRIRRRRHGHRKLAVRATIELKRPGAAPARAQRTVTLRLARRGHRAGRG